MEIFLPNRAFKTLITFSSLHVKFPPPFRPVHMNPIYSFSLRFEMARKKNILKNICAIYSCFDKVAHQLLIAVADAKFLNSSKKLKMFENLINAKRKFIYLVGIAAFLKDVSWGGGRRFLKWPFYFQKKKNKVMLRKYRWIFTKNGICTWRASWSPCKKRKKEKTAGLRKEPCKRLSLCIHYMYLSMPLSRSAGTVHKSLIFRSAAVTWYRLIIVYFQKTLKNYISNYLLWFKLLNMDIKANKKLLLNS